MRILEGNKKSVIVKIAEDSSILTQSPMVTYRKIFLPLDTLLEMRVLICDKIDEHVYSKG